MDSYIDEEPTNVALVNLAQAAHQLLYRGWLDAQLCQVKNVRFLGHETTLSRLMLERLEILESARSSLRVAVESAETSTVRLLDELIFVQLAAQQVIDHARSQHCPTREPVLLEICRLVELLRGHAPVASAGAEQTVRSWFA